MSQDQIATKQLRSGGAKTRSDSEMSVSDLANLMKSQFALYQQITKDELKRMSDSLTEFALCQKNTQEDLKRMSDSLSAQMNTLRANISVEIEQLREENNNTFGKLTISIEKVKSDTVSAADRNFRMNDLIVSGVPFTPTEDLSAYFSKWCQCLGYTENCTPLVDIRRLAKGAQKAGTASPLLIQFAITVQRNDFFARYLRSRSLSLVTIGFSVNKRIFINENLGIASRELRSKALTMKKNGQLTGVFTRDGTVYVKKSGSDRAMAVTCETELEAI